MGSLTPAQIEYMVEHADDNKQPNLIATCVLCMFFPVLAVFLRFVARFRVVAGIKLDDWLILAALIPMAGMTTTTAFTVRYGEGKHIIFINNPEGFAINYVAGIVVYALTSTLTKLSILALYVRIFPSQTLKNFAIGIGSLVVLYNLALIIFDFVQCIPLSTLWTGMGHCTPTEAAFVTLAVVNVITDIMILVLPIKYVIGLQMRRDKKVQILIAFALGGIVCIFGIIRSYFVSEANAIDPTWTAADGAIWSQTEIAVGIVSACLPVYRPLFIKSSELANYGYGTRNGKLLRSTNNNGNVSSKNMSLRMKSMQKGSTWVSVGTGHDEQNSQHSLTGDEDFQQQEVKTYSSGKE